MKRIISIMLAAMMLLSITAGMNLTAFSQEGVTYSWDEEEAVLTFFGSGALGDYTRTNQPDWYDYSRNANEIVIDEGITEIGDYCFYRTNADKITISGTVYRIGIGAFYNSYASTYEFSKGLRVIEDYAFYSNDNLTDFRLPDSVERIGVAAFARSTIIDFYIPDSWSSFDANIFDGYTENCYVSVSENNTNYIVVDDALLSSDGRTLLYYPLCCSDDKEGEYAERFTLPDSVRYIADGAFEDNTYLLNVDLNNASTIGDYAFYNTKLKVVIAPSTVSNIGKNSFPKGEKLVFITSKNSFADQYATQNGNLVSYDGKCILTLDANSGVFEDGSDTAEKELIFDFPYGELPTPKKAGYTFIGWKETFSYNTTTWFKYVNEDTVCDFPVDTTVTAEWAENAVVVSIDLGADDVELPENESDALIYENGISYKLGDSYNSKIPTATRKLPTKEGYHIDYWVVEVIDENGDVTYEPITSDTLVTNSNNHNIKIFWAPNNYTVKLNFSSSSTSSSYTTYTATYDKEFVLPKANAYTRTGYCFNYKWSTQKNATEAEYVSGQTVKNLITGGTITLFPVYDHYPELPVNTPTETMVTERNGRVYYSFIPEVTGAYVFYSEGDLDVVGQLCDENMKELATDDNSGEYNNFRIIYNLTEGVRYNLVAYHNDYFLINKPFKLTIKRVTSCVVTFDAGDGELEGGNQRNVSYGLEYGDIPYWSKTGYYFRYWTKANDTTPIYGSSIVDEVNDFTLYPNSEPIQYKVNLYAGTTTNMKRVKTITFTYDEAQKLPTAEELGINYSGYHFMGWTKARNGKVVNYTDGQELLNLSSYPGAVIALYSVYTSATHEVNLFSEGEGVGSFTYTENEKVNVPTAESLKLSKPGYIFIGWSKNERLSNVDIEDGGEFTVDSIDWNNPVLFAVWKRLVYTVSIYLDDELVNQGMFDADYVGTLPNTIYNLVGGSNYDKKKYDNRKLVGYRLEGSENYIDFEPGATFKNLTDFDTEINLYAVTVDTGVYTVNYYIGKSLARCSYAIEDDETLEDYWDVVSDWNYITGKFVGWATEPDINEVVYENESVIPAGTFKNNDALNLYAVFEYIPHNIYYDIGDADMNDPNIISFYEGAYLDCEDLPTPVKDSYIFDGWYMDPEYTESFDTTGYGLGRFMNIDSDVILYAKFDKSLINFAFIGNGNGAVVDGTYVKNIKIWSGGEMGELPVPVRPGYIFDGWYTKATGGLEVTSNSWAEAVSNYSTQLYAHWITRSYYIFFNANGGECDTSYMNVYFDTAVSGLPTPTRYGYTFNGWYYIENDEEFSIYDTYVYDFEDDLDVYARWEVKYVPVRFNSNGGSYVSTRSYAVGEQLGRLPSTYREGYTFDGWYTEQEGGSVIKPIVVVEDCSGYVFYAHWISNEYLITFDADGGECDTTQIKVSADTTTLTLPVPVKENYNFLGWYFGDERMTEKELVDSNGYILDFDITLVAKWEYALEPEIKQGWVEENGSWYYYDENGNMTTGWQKVGNYWYYMNDDGVMQTGWVSVKGVWYYLNSNGRMLTGWQKVGNYWYYMNSSGAMQTDWQQIGGKWYYLNSNGRMLTGWQKVGNYWYYMNSSGVMQTGWIKLSGKWYYLEASGRMRTANLTYNGKVYRFNSSGVCLNP